MHAPLTQAKPICRIVQGDCRDLLARLPDNFVQCVVTSPPYWGLRDYKLPPLIWPDGWSGTHGLEPTYQLYLEHSVQIFREVRRVLRPDGILWLNIGDSYAGGGRGGNPESSPHKKQATNFGCLSVKDTKVGMEGLKPKDLCGIPWRLALALQEAGWYLRQDIIWHKPNPMPESVTDRCTKAHEYLFMLTKSPKYYYDSEAIKEPAKYGRGTGKDAFRSKRYQNNLSFDNSAKTPASGAHGHSFDGVRNARSVWTISTKPYPEAHFATFPPDLVELCIKASTPEHGCCSVCKRPWVRIVDKQRSFESGSGRAGNLPSGKNGPNLQGGGETLDVRRGPTVSSQTIGWQPACKCNAIPTPSLVLDPFAGSGTVGMVANKLNRHALLFEQSAEYIKLIQKRCGV
jgi:DNA modification methylase